MGKFLKRFVAFGVSTALMVAGLMPLIKVYATQYGSGDYELSVSVDDNNDWVASITIDGNNWSNSSDIYFSETGVYNITAELHVPNESVKETTSIRAGGDSGTYNIVQAGNTEDWENTHQKFTYTIRYEVQSARDHLSLNPYSENSGGNHEQGPQGNTEAVIRVRGGEGSYDDSIRDEDGNVLEEKIVNYSDTYIEGSFAINGGGYLQMMKEDKVEGESYSEARYTYDSEPEDNTVTISFATLWHMEYVDEIIINGQHYQISNLIDYSDKVNYLGHYNGQIVSFNVENVQKAELYDITVKIGRNPHPYIGNFLWTADPEQEFEKRCEPENIDEDGNPICEYILDEDGNKIPGHDYVGHSTLTLLEVLYTVNNITYHCSAREGANVCAWWPVDDEDDIQTCDPSDEECHIPYLEFESHSNGMVDGSLVVPEDARVTMQVIPDYGYQVMNVNMAELTTSDDGIGEFTFTVESGAAYFVADVVKTEDIVKTNTDIVSSGAIDLGEDQTTLEHGSAILEVEDVDLSDQDIEGFEGAAEGYDVSNYLGISLFNITCKGSATCTGAEEDSWNEQVRDLNEPATITLQLEDGVNGNEIIIVHQKHDGTYEVIPTTYDPETQTITFTTTSFSNYAIASRTVVTPDTGTFVEENKIGETNKTLLATSVVMMIIGFVVRLAIKHTRRN